MLSDAALMIKRLLRCAVKRVRGCTRHRTQYLSGASDVYLWSAAAPAACQRAK